MTTAAHIARYAEALKIAERVGHRIGQFEAEEALHTWGHSGLVNLPPDDVIPDARAIREEVHEALPAGIVLVLSGEDWAELVDVAEEAAYDTFAQRQRDADEALSRVKVYHDWGEW